MATQIVEIPDLLPPGTEWPVRLLAIIVCLLSAPGLGLFQTWWVSKSLKRHYGDRASQNRIVTPMSVSHGITWAVSLITIFTVMGWPSMVTQDWGLKPIPLVYELTILMPLLLSMTMSWIVFYDIQACARFPDQSWRLRLRQRMSYVNVRFRTHVLMFALPMVLLMITMRFWHPTTGLSIGQTIGAASLLCISMIFIFPTLVTLVWKTEPIIDTQLNEKLLSICQQSQVGVQQIRTWKTGYQIANAAVTGVFPRTRIILLSDLLIKRFEPEEVEAILRHEVGHVRLKHLPTKMLFIVLPMLILIIDRAAPGGMTDRLSNAFHTNGWSVAGNHAVHLLAIGYAIYLSIVLRWLSHRMELEADMFAAFPRSTMNLKDDVFDVRGGYIEQTRAALWRLAVMAPDRFRKRTFLHPSLKDRILSIEKIARTPKLATHYRRSFLRRKWMVVIGWGVLLSISLTFWALN